MKTLTPVNRRDFLKTASAAAREIVGKPVNKTGVEDLLWAVAMLPEFQLIY